MRTFRSLGEMESFLLGKVKMAVEFAQRKAFTEFNRYVHLYYDKWQPQVYERTRQLLRSLSQTTIYGTGKGYGGAIYYDVNKMDYSRKNLHKIRHNGMWKHPYVHGVYSSDGKFINHGIPHLVLESAAHGVHPVKGGGVQGVAIWDEPMRVLESRYKEIFKQAFNDAGLHVT